MHEGTQKAEGRNGSTPTLGKGTAGTDKSVRHMEEMFNWNFEKMSKISPLYSKQRFPQQKQRILKVHKGNGKYWHQIS